MKPKVLLAFDYGRKYIGIAVGDTTGASSRGLTTIKQSGSGEHWKRILEIVREWNPEALVVGMPSQADGTESLVIKEIKRFNKKLAELSNLRVYEMNEHLSSVAAQWQQTDNHYLNKSRGSQRTKITNHNIAAAIILQDFVTYHWRV